ncbi:MAG: hypothetical protein IJ087_01315 [Eggerthellaceae bacterium]|nr:hypothetical protein [Eggerthellaceae bacterium]
MAKYGKADVDMTLEFWMADNEEQTEWSCYQFEYDDDEEPVFSAFVTKQDDGTWEGHVCRGSWAEGNCLERFDDEQEAMRWCSSWAFDPSVGQGVHEYPEVTLSSEDVKRICTAMSYIEDAMAAAERTGSYRNADWVCQMNNDDIAETVKSAFNEQKVKANY